MADTNVEDMAAMRLAERKAFDRATIDDYANMLMEHYFRMAVGAKEDPLPNKEVLLECTKRIIERAYDNSVTLEHLHSRVRMTTDPKQLQNFLNRLPVTVIGDMILSTGTVIRGKDETKDEVAGSLDYALKHHLKVAEATLHLLKRFEKLQDPEVEYVQDLVQTSQGIFLKNQAAFRKTGVLKEEKEEKGVNKGEETASW